MSGKVNIYGIVSGHFATLCDAKGSSSIVDILTFFILPLFFSGLGAYFGFNLNKDIASLLVNFGAIFTALLLSVLVLVYDQENKIDDKERYAKEKGVAVDLLSPAKKKLLEQLYFNISFSIVSSLLLIGVCFFHAVLDGYSGAGQSAGIGLFFAKYLFTPAAIFIAINLMLTITMIVKRMHTLLILK